MDKLKQTGNGSKTYILLDNLLDGPLARRGQDARAAGSSRKMDAKKARKTKAETIGSIAG